MTSNDYIDTIEGHKHEILSCAEEEQKQGIKRPMRLSEIKLSYGFLRRLEEEGQNVKIGQDINDILFLDEREKATKERLEEEHKRKLKKPRPRDVVDFDTLKRNQMQKEYDRLESKYNRHSESV